MFSCFLILFWMIVFHSFPLSPAEPAACAGTTPAVSWLPTANTHKLSLAPLHANAPCMPGWGGRSLLQWKVRFDQRHGNSRGPGAGTVTRRYDVAPLESAAAVLVSLDLAAVRRRLPVVDLTFLRRKPQQNLNRGPERVKTPPEDSEHRDADPERAPGETRADPPRHGGRQGQGHNNGQGEDPQDRGRGAAGTHDAERLQRGGVEQNHAHALGRARRPAGPPAGPRAAAHPREGQAHGVF